MSSSNYSCHFCGAENRINMYISKCQKCAVEFFVTEIPPLYLNWQLESITYRIEGPIYHSLVMRLKEKSTTLWFSPPGAIMKKLEIPKVFPIIPPQKIVALAEQLNKMRAFL